MNNSTSNFSELSNDDINLLSSYGKTRKYPKNSIMIHKGDESTGVYLIQKGRVKVYDSDEMGAEITFRYQGPGEFFGEMALIDQSTRSASITAVENTVVVFIDNQSFLRCMRENPEFTTKLLRYFIERITNLTDQLSDCALKNVYQRVRDKLTELASEENGLQIITGKYTHKDIAGLVGSGREMISRIMKKLENGNYLEKQNGQLVILRDLPRNLPR